MRLSILVILVLSKDNSVFFPLQRGLSGIKSRRRLATVTRRIII